jgi:MFS family permease
MNRPLFARSADGRRITDRRLKRGLRVSILAGSLGVTGWAMLQGMPLRMFMEALGATGVLIGLISTVMQVALVIQIPGALFAERLASRKRVWGGVMLLSRSLWFLPPLLLACLPHRPLAIAWIMVGLAAFSALLSQSVTAFWFGWMADLVPDSIRGRFWGRRQTCTMTAFLISMALSGYILDAFPPPGSDGGSWAGFTMVFVIGAIMGCADIVVHLWVPEPVSRTKAEVRQWLARVAAPLRNPDFRRLTIAMGVYTFAVGMTSLSIIFLKQDFHVTYSHLAACMIASSVGIVASSFIWGYVMDRVGGRAFGAIMVAVGPLVLLCWFFVKDTQASFVDFFGSVWGLGHAIRAVVGVLPRAWQTWIQGATLPQPVWILILVNFVAGSIYGGINLCHLNLSAALVPKKGRIMAMAVHWSVVGLIGAFGALAGGHVMDYFAAHPVDYVFPTGTRFAFHHVLVVAHMTILWLVVLPILLGVRRRRGEPPVREAFSRLLTTNPVRAVTHIYMLGSAATRRRRAHAVRKLGQQRTAIAVIDLIEKLDDASAEVREEAAFALGSIGSRDAVEALVNKLEDPHADLSPQIAKALRISRHPHGVPALLRKLKDPDRETRSESARTLGEIGDRRAIPSLLDLLAGTSDTKVVSASSEALSRLGEVAAIYEILPRMKMTKNPVLKRSLAVAIGDLLGEPDGFYKVLTKEQQTRGSETERMLKELRRRVRNATRRELTPQGKWLSDKTRELETLLDENAFATCADVLFDLAIGLSALTWGVEYGGNSRALVNDLIWRDQRFGIGMWYLDLMRPGREGAEPVEADYLDILLGIYFLFSRALRG